MKFFSKYKVNSCRHEAVEVYCGSLEVACGSCRLEAVGVTMCSCRCGVVEVTCGSCRLEAVEVTFGSLEITCGIIAVGKTTKLVVSGGGWRWWGGRWQ